MSAKLQKKDSGNKKRKQPEEAPKEAQSKQPVVDGAKPVGEASVDSKPAIQKKQKTVLRAPRNTVTKVCKKLALSKRCTTIRINPKSNSYIAIDEFLRIPINNCRVGLPVIKKPKSSKSPSTLLMGTFYNWQSVFLYLAQKLKENILSSDEYGICLDAIAKHFGLDSSQQKSTFWNNFVTENVLLNSNATLDAISSIPLVGDVRDAKVVFKSLEEHYYIGNQLNQHLVEMCKNSMTLKRLYDGESITSSLSIPITKPKGPKNKSYVLHLSNPISGSEAKFPEGVNTLNEAIQDLYGGQAEDVAKLDHVAYTIDYLPKHGIWFLSTQQQPAAGFIPDEIKKFLLDKYEVDIQAVSHPSASICSDGRAAQLLLVPAKKAKEQKDKKQKEKDQAEKDKADGGSGKSDSDIEKELEKAMEVEKPVSA